MTTETRLYHVIHADDKNGIHKLLSDKQMLQFKDIREFLSLYAAAEGGHESVLEAFLENGAEVDSAIQTDDEANITVEVDYSRTALLLAPYDGRTPVVRLMLDNGADIEARNDKSETALMLAVGQGHIQVVKLLLEKGTQLEPRGGDWHSGTTALVQAAHTCNVQTMRLVLQAGANLNARDFRFGNATLLHLAIPHRAAGHSDSDEIATMLLESGADLEAQDRRETRHWSKLCKRGRWQYHSFCWKEERTPTLSKLQ